MQVRVALNVYLASKFQNRHAVQAIADLLQDEGHEVVSSWHTKPPLPREEMTDEEQRRQSQVCAMTDLRDIDKADVLVWVDYPDVLVGANETHAHAKVFSGGSHFETGYALGRHLPVIIFGRRVNVFHTLLPQVESSDQLVEELRKLYL